jgi:hypothetical protein
MAKKDEQKDFNAEQNQTTQNGDESAALQADISEPATSTDVTEKYIYNGHPDVFGFEDGEKLLATGGTYPLDPEDPTTIKLVRRNKLSVIKQEKETK